MSKILVLNVVAGVSKAQKKFGMVTYVTPGWKDESRVDMRAIGHTVINKDFVDSAIAVEMSRRVPAVYEVDTEIGERDGKPVVVIVGASLEHPVDIWANSEGKPEAKTEAKAADKSAKPAA